MCTASWTRASDGGFTLFFSRDEGRGRGRALPPQRLEVEGGAALAPIDSDAGGTWLAADDGGLVVGLLNRYHAAPPDPPEGFTSRGHLVRTLAGAGSLDAAMARLDALDLRTYRPCTVLLAAPGEAPQIVDWDGAERDGPHQARRPLMSSGYDFAGAAESRRAAWRETVGADTTPGEPDARDLLAFHRSHHPTRGPYSPCMHRPDASSVSLTRVDVTASTVSMAYADGPPCTSPLGAPLSLARRA
ncbi:MAG: NRDE family protein [Acidobacteriota bacterium]